MSAVIIELLLLCPLFRPALLSSTVGNALRFLIYDPIMEGELPASHAVLRGAPLCRSSLDMQDGSSVCCARAVRISHCPRFSHSTAFPLPPPPPAAAALPHVAFPVLGSARPTHAFPPPRPPPRAGRLVKDPRAPGRAFSPLRRLAGVLSVFFVSGVMHEVLFW